MTKKPTFPKQYGYESSAFRAIINYEKKFGRNKNEQFVVCQLDADCFEVKLITLNKNGKKK